MGRLVVQGVAYVGGHPSRPEGEDGLTLELDRRGIDVLRPQRRPFLSVSWPDVLGLDVQTPSAVTLAIVGPPEADPWWVETVTCRFGLGHIARAIALHEENLDARRRVLGPEHPDTAQSGYNLASGYAREGRYDEALSLLRDVVDRYTTAVGAAHPDTVRARALLTDVTSHRP